MLRRGQQLSLEIEKPAVGGAMIARASGQVVLVTGAIPGERATVEIERVGKGVAHGRATAIEHASVDRRPSPSGDPACGGCLYAEIAYPRQLIIKTQVIADALARIGRIPWPAPISIAASPEQGYRMRARLHRRGGRFGWFREGSHELCDVATTGQLLPETAAALARLDASLARAGVDADLEVEVSENATASERAVHLESAGALDRSRLAEIAADPAFSGVSVADPRAGGAAHAIRVSGSPRVHDVFDVGGIHVALARHVLAFFQGNRYLLAPLAAHVVDFVVPGETIVDLYAGAGLFAVSAAAAKQARVIAVEGDPVSSADLALNAATFDGRVEPVHQSVEGFTARRQPAPGTVIVDPPRTGMSKDALRGVVGLRARQIVYVSCDVATLARDARGLVDAGYQLVQVDAFDLFPNTPHVETVSRFEQFEPA